MDRARVVWTRLLYLSGPPALAAVGAAWLASAWSDNNDEPMVWVGLMVFGAVLTTIEHVVADFGNGRSPLPTRGGQAVLRQRQDAGRPDDPGPGTSAAWEVALAGAWALWSSEPALAAQLDAPREPVGFDTGGGCGACGCG